MIRWDPQTNCLTEWHPPDWRQPLRFTGWGCEVGNWFGFFAQERSGGISCKIIRHHLEPPGPAILKSAWEIKLPKATFHLQLQDEIVSPKCMVRSLSLRNSAATISWFADAVIRLVVPWEQGLTAHIEDRELEHEDKNIYYDTEEDAVMLRWPDGRRLIVRRESASETLPVLTPYLYVRDQPRRPHPGQLHSAERAWVIHARLLADQPASFVYRWSRFTFWDRGLVGRYVVSPSRLAHRWRAGEWKLGGRGSLYGLWPLLPDQELQQSIRIEID